VKELWSALGIADIVEEAMLEDRSGSGILEVLLRSSNNVIIGLDNVGIKETIAITCWYLWWIRRRRTHGEDVPPLYKCKLSILTMVANSVKVSKPSGQGMLERWSRPSPRQVKLNVDASFHADDAAGATGAVIRDYKG
jgi:hypothetical protein